MLKEEVDCSLMRIYDARESVELIQVSQTICLNCSVGSRVKKEELRLGDRLMTFTALSSVTSPPKPSTAIKTKILLKMFGFYFYFFSFLSAQL
jgi:hypothetical protein